jgi:putative acetyltransferase
MSVPTLIRQETPADTADIAEVVSAAFQNHPHSDGSEPAIIERLRSRGELAVSLVAEAEGRIVGHVAFSPIRISPAVAGWFGLGPLAVHPSFQSLGIGSELVTRGLSELTAIGAMGCVVFGNPAYYGRFGFKSWPSLTYAGGPSELFLALALVGKVSEGSVTYSPAFSAA